MGISFTLGRSKFERVVNIWVVLVILAIIVWCALATFSNRTIPFDAATWKQSQDSGDRDIQYRMVDDLVAKLSVREDVTLEEAIGLLGEVEGMNRKPATLRYYVGRKYWGPFPVWGYTLDLSFDENDRLIKTHVDPE